MCPPWSERPLLCCGSSLVPSLLVNHLGMRYEGICGGCCCATVQILVATCHYKVGRSTCFYFETAWFSTVGALIMQHFKPVVSNDASLSGNSFLIVASHGLPDSKSGRSLLHRHCIKLRYIRDMAETSLVVRDGNGNRNSSPTLLFNVSGVTHPRIPYGRLM